MPPPFDAVLFDLLTGLLDSWSHWDRIAKDPAAGRRWRLRYLELSYGAGRYRPFESLVGKAAEDVGLTQASAQEMIAQWDQLEAWPEVPQVLPRLSGLRLGAVTNCSEALARRAAQRVGFGFSVVVSAERAGAYKPEPEPYGLALGELGLSPDRVLYVAGSPYDVIGASSVGMTVLWHNRAGLISEAGALAREVTESLHALGSLALGGE
jgi:2-haloalkanoic acid dehalogenase type II